MKNLIALKFYILLHKIVVYIPLINLLALLLMILMVYLDKGSLPLYNSPDPESLKFVYSLYLYSLIAVILSLFVYPILLLTFLITKHPYKYKYALIYFLGLGLLILPYFNNNIMNWIAD